MAEVVIQLDMARIAELASVHCRVIEHQVLVLLRRGLSGAEIAKELQITPGHARKLKHDALAKLRRALEDTGIETNDVDERGAS